jgi:hypothetical protein
MSYELLVLSGLLASQLSSDKVLFKKLNCTKIY